MMELYKLSLFPFCLISGDSTSFQGQMLCVFKEKSCSHGKGFLT